MLSVLGVNTCYTGFSTVTEGCNVIFHYTCYDKLMDRMTNGQLKICNLGGGATLKHEKK